KAIGYLASGYVCTRRLEEAERAARRGLALAETKYGLNHWELKMSLMHLRIVLEARSKGDEAAAVERRRSELPEANPDEFQASMRRMQQRMFSSVGELLQGLGLMSGNEGAPRGISDTNEAAQDADSAGRAPDTD